MMVHYMGPPQYTCVGQNVVVETFNTYVSSATGRHMDGKTNKDVKAIYFNEQRTTFIPLRFSPFPNLVIMNIEKSGLTYLNQTTFKDLTQLKYIQLDGNMIEYVPRKTFYGMDNLEWIGLAGNKIRFLYSDMLVGLTELRRFSASENPIEEIGSGFFRDNTKLQYVYFYKTKLRMIGSKLVRMLPNLEIANFEGNVCTNINLQRDPNMGGKLTTEFTQKCGIDCSRALLASEDTIQDLTNENGKLNREIISIKIEKQSMRFNCGNQDY